MTTTTLTLLSALLAALPAERDVAPAVSGPNPGSTGIHQLIARPGGGFVALYLDDRSVDSNGKLGYRIARLSASLDAQDSTGFHLPLSMATLYRLRGVFDGSGILLAWVDQLGSASFAINVARVSETGAILTPAQTVATTTATVGAFAADFDGDRTLLAWVEEGSMSSTLFAAAVSASGAVSGPWTVAQGALDDVAVASSSGVTLIAWSVYRPNDASTLEVVRVPAGAVPPTTSAVLQTGRGLSYLDAIGTTGGAWYLAWAHSPAAGTIEVHGAPLSAAGVLGTPVAIESVATQYAINPRLAWSGSDVRALWTRYLDVRTRTVPLTGAPSTPVQTLRSSLGHEPSAGIACSAGVCAAEWTEPVPTLSLVSSAQVTRLSGTSTALDVPAKEISFPADAHSWPTLAWNGQSFEVLFTRRVGRGGPELMRRRLSEAGAWLDADPLALAVDRELAAAVPTPGGGVLVANRAPFLSDDDQIYGFFLPPSGAAQDKGVWASPYDRPMSVHLACAATRCALLYESYPGYLPKVLDPAGNVVQSSNVYVWPLSDTDFIRLRGVGRSFVAVYSGYNIPLRASVASEIAFPTFGMPFELTSSGESTYGALVSEPQGDRVAVIWTERTDCGVFGRVVDAALELALGAAPVKVLDCGTATVQPLQIVPRTGGYALLYAETGWVNNVQFADYYQLDLDAQLAPVGAARAVGSAGGDLQGFALTRIGGKDVVSYSRFDDAPGVSSRRAKLAGLDPAPAPDAGHPDAAALPDASGPDATGPDAGGLDAAAPDAAALADASEPPAPIVGIDAGSSEPPEVAVDEGCGCSSRGAAAPAFALLAALAWVVRRRGAAQ